jgi:hypothetical protein
MDSRRSLPPYQKELTDSRLRGNDRRDESIIKLDGGGNDRGDGSIRKTDGGGGDRVKNHHESTPRVNDQEIPRRIVE